MSRRGFTYGASDDCSFRKDEEVASSVLNGIDMSNKFESHKMLNVVSLVCLLTGHDHIAVIASTCASLDRDKKSGRIQR